MDVGVEYWDSYTAKWNPNARLLIPPKSNKLLLEDAGQPLSFFIYNLTLEHSDPLAKNFLAVLSGGGQVLRHRIAFYSEAEGNEAVEAISRLGAQVVTRKLIPQPRGPKTERDFLIARKHQPRAVSLQPGVKIQPSPSLSSIDSPDTAPAVSSDTDKKNKMILRRQSTGSYTDLNGGSSNNNNARTPTVPSLRKNSSSGSGTGPGIFKRRSSFRFRAENTPAGPTSVWYDGSLVRRHKSSDHSLDSQISEDELLEEVEEFTGPPLGALMTPGKPGGILSRLTHFNTSTASLPSVLKTPNKNTSAKEANKPNDDNCDDVFDEEDIADRSCFPSDDQISDRDGEHYCVRYDPAKMFGLGESGGIARFQFDDYPDDLVMRDIGEENRTEGVVLENSERVSRGSGRWIRRSFEELKIDTLSSNHHHQQQPKAISTGSRRRSNSASETNSNCGSEVNTIELPLLKNERLFQIAADASGGVAKSTEQNVHQDTKQEEVEEIITQSERRKLQSRVTREIGNELRPAGEKLEESTKTTTYL